MKKIFTIALAVAALAACNKSEVIETPQGAAISFENVFVDNATKAADLNKDNIPDFGVYGYVEANGTQGQIFNNQTVTKGTAGYTYSPVQYWIASAQYYFTAFAPQTDAAWSYETTNAQNGTITFNNETAKANQDFLFAFEKPAKTADAITSQPEPVGFNFNHMLSRVKFTFTNGFGAGSNIDLKVTDVNITNAYKTGTLAIANGVAADAWTPADNTLNVPFGAVGTTALDEGVSGSTEHFYLIPANATYTITFNVELIQAGVSVDNYARTASVEVDMKKGYSYDLKATLDASNTSDDGELFPIEFSVESVGDWAEFSGVDATVTK